MSKQPAQHMGDSLVKAGGLLFAVAYLFAAGPCQSTEITFSTYFGGSYYDGIVGDSTVDAQGNFYAVGDTRSPDFPVTPGAFDTTFNDNSGNTDAFVAKFDPNGKLLWSTFIGGPTRDSFNAVRVDDQGFVYVAGAAGPGAPTTPGVLQPTFAGGDGSLAGGANRWDGYVAKIKPDGSGLVWATYVGTSGDESIRGMDIDSQGNVYLATSYRPATWPSSWFTRNQAWPSSWFKNSYQKSPQGGTDSVIIKLNSSGQRVVWASYLGGSKDESRAPNLALDRQGNLHVLTDTLSSDMPTTPGAFDQTHNGGLDIFVAKLSPNGKELLFGTYLGTRENDGAGGKRAIAVDSQGNVVISAWTFSRNFPTTPGAYRTTPLEFTSWGATGVTAKFSRSGQLLACTYLGNGEGVSLDRADNIYVSGSTALKDFPITADAHQKSIGGKSDAFIAKFSKDLTHLLYASYLGGSGDDFGRSTIVDAAGAFYVAGATESGNWPVINPHQAKYGGRTDAFIAKFQPGKSRNPAQAESTP